jgi:pSer/pThr/pTyr-binding forkhead associated (FHA) protein
MERSSLMTSPSQLALRFISGKYQGSEVPLMDAHEIVVGRASDVAIVLVEEMVSRRHARFVMTESDVAVEDLGSTNGTFVNGEKIQRSSLKEGDRVLIGTSIMKVVQGEQGPTSKRRVLTPKPSIAPRGPAKSMSGQIEEIPLPDLLQLLGTSKKSGVLVITADQDVGRLIMHRGIITFAEINEDDIPPLKAAIRMLGWTRGTFDFEPPEERTIPVAINLSVQELLMEGLRQIDELNVLQHKLPPPEARLVVPTPLEPRVRSLSPDELDIFQLAYNQSEVLDIFNRSQVTDLQTAQIMLKLINAGYLRQS